MDERNEDYDIYGSFACVYDKFMDNVPYKEWGKYLKSLLEEQGISDGLMLELGCGTGSLTEILADAGYVVASMYYRSSAEAHMPSQIIDVKTAIRFLRAHADEYEIDPDRIGIIGTAATIASGSYRKEIERLAPKTEVFEQACPLFVPLVENAFVSPDDPIPRLTAERYLTPIREAGVDTLILGCTHYPIISETIRRVMGENVTLISSGREAAKSCRTVLEENGLLCDGKTDGTQQYFVSDDTESFYKVAELFLGQSVESCVECIDIERY